MNGVMRKDTKDTGSQSTDIQDQEATTLSVPTVEVKVEVGLDLDQGHVPRRTVSAMALPVGTGKDTLEANQVLQV